MNSKVGYYYCAIIYSCNDNITIREYASTKRNTNNNAYVKIRTNAAFRDPVRQKIVSRFPFFRTRDLNARKDVIRIRVTFA